MSKEPDTLRVSGSYALFRDEALRVSERLEEVALVLRKRIDLYDAKGIARASAIARRLRVMAASFDAWPSVSPAVVASERASLVPELARLLSEALRILESFPTMGPLGRVRHQR